MTSCRPAIHPVTPHLRKSIFYRDGGVQRSRQYGCWSRDLPHVVNRGLRDADEGAAPSHIQRRQVMAKRSMFVGMDVHKESIDVSLAEEGRDGECGAMG